PVYALTLSADGKTLASESTDSTVLLWDVAELVRPAAAVNAALTAKEVESLWQDLADADAGKAYQAINLLSAAPAETVPFLRNHIKAIPPADPQVVAKLLDDLNSTKFALREK